jgi:prolyl-tRNA synthetase
MRFRELHIETRRERPAKARSDGEAFLIRAGYVNVPGELTELGRRSALRISQLTHQGQQLEGLGAAILRTAEGEALAVSRLGDTSILHCRNCGYACDAGRATAKKSAEPQQLLLPLERVQTPGCKTIESLATFLGVPPSQTAKALLYTRPGTDALVFVVVRGDMQLAEPKLRAAVGDVQPATPEQIANAGAVPGYASPIGVRGAFVVVDDLIPFSFNLIAGANEEGFHLKNANIGRDYSADKVADITLAGAGDPCSICESPLVAVTGIVLADKGGLRSVNALLVLAEEHHDERGLRLPFGIAPFDVYLMHLSSRTLDTQAAASEIHQGLEAAGVAVLFDDREAHAGVKFNDADLIGCPIRITVGDKHLQDRMVESKKRIGNSSELIPVEDIIRIVRAQIPLTQ